MSNRLPSSKDDTPGPAAMLSLRTSLHGTEDNSEPECSPGFIQPSKINEPRWHIPYPSAEVFVIGQIEILSTPQAQLGLLDRLPCHLHICGGEAGRWLGLSMPRIAVSGVDPGLRCHGPSSKGCGKGFILVDNAEPAVQRRRLSKRN